MKYDTATFLPLDISVDSWRVDPSGCWLWLDKEDQRLFREKYVRYRDAYGERQYLHRVIATNKYGPILRGFRVEWTCSNPGRCINHEHLKVVSSYSNTKQRKLREDQIAFIKIDQRTYAEIAKIYNVSISLIQKIKIGERHAGVDPALTEDEASL